MSILLLIVVISFVNTQNFIYCQWRERQRDRERRFFWEEDRNGALNLFHDFLLLRHANQSTFCL